MSVLDNKYGEPFRKIWDEGYALGKRHGRWLGIVDGIIGTIMVLGLIMIIKAFVVA